MHCNTVGSFVAPLMAAIVLSLAAGVSADVTFFVSPSGNDAWSGTLADPNASQADGPFATPEHARDAARLAKTRAAGAIHIVLRGGVYPLAQPLVLTPDDSGIDAAPLTWTAYAKEIPVLSGGRALSGWEKVTVNNVPAWKAAIPAELGPLYFRELWIDGARLGRARYPKKGTLAVTDATKAKDHAAWRHAESEIPFARRDLPDWSSLTDSEVVVTSKWCESRLPIESIDQEHHEVHTGKKTTFHPEPNDRYWIENVKENLTEPGEWCLDSKEHAVYLIPPANIPNPNDAQVIAPLLPQIVRLTGDLAGKRWVQNIQFSGILFSYNEWYYDHVAPGQPPRPDLSGVAQADIMTPGAIYAEGARNCTFDHCIIAHVGSYGIECAAGCQHDRITHCTMTDLGAGGVKIGTTDVNPDPELQASNNEVSDSRITDGGVIFPSCVGLFIGQSHDNLIAHNEISHLWYTAISVGWTWGYRASLAQNNIIEYNDVHHIGLKEGDEPPILSDMGGIYTLGDEKGTVIRFNRFHDIAGHKYGGWGIYFDEGTTDILAENNLVYRTTHGGFHQHYGKDNIVRNNIFAFGNEAQVVRTRVEEHRSLSFLDNVVYWDKGLLLNGNWTKLNVLFDGNDYWHTKKGEIHFAKMTWDQWRKAGQDVHGRIADPGFRNPEQGDFTLADPSANLGGFKAFDLSQVGPRQ